MKKLLEIKNLEINFPIYDKKVYALRRASFDLYEDEILAIVGESGSGKSVLVQAILQLLPKAANISGNVFYQNYDLLKFNEKKMRNIRGDEISIIFQDPFSSLNPTMKIGKQILEAIKKNGSKDKVYTLLEDVGINSAKNRYNQYPHQLSGGERQRVMIAIAIASHPKIIIADEPTTALDVTIQKGILDLLKMIKEKYKTSIIFITHDLSVVSYLCKRALVMYGGKIVETASVKDLINSPKHPYTKMLIDSIAKIDSDSEIKTIDGVCYNSLKKEIGCLFSNRCPEKEHFCETDAPIFHRVTSDHLVNCHIFKNKHIEILKECKKQSLKLKI